MEDFGEMADETLVAIGLPIYGSHEHLAACLQSLDLHTPVGVPIVIIDDGAPEHGVDNVVALFCASTRRPFTWIFHRQNLGFVQTANHIFELTDGMDVVLINSDVVVGAGWFEALCETAALVTHAATVTAATNEGTLAGIPELRRAVSPARIAPVIDGLSDLNARQIYRGLPTAIGHCTLFRRRALDLVGDFDECFGRGYGEEVDFSQRCIEHGFVHVLAPQCLVFHEGGASFRSDSEAPIRKASNEAILRERYPSYETAISIAMRERLPSGSENGRRSSLRVALISRSGVIFGLDCRMVHSHPTGTGRLVLELAQAMAHNPLVHQLVLFVGSDMHSFWRQACATWSTECRLIVSSDDSVSTEHVCDIFVRPCQFFDLAEVLLARTAAPRMHLHVLDGIAYEQPNYFASPKAWATYRELCEWTMGIASSLSSNSHSVSLWIQSIGLESPVAVIGNGLDHVQQIPGRDVHELSDTTTPIRLVQYGAAFAHKNRQFSMKVAFEIAGLGHNVELTLVGPEPEFGSTVQSERSLLRHLQQALRECEAALPGSLSVSWLGHVPELELQSLITSADVVLYPTTVEGFGLVPFESAALGTPCLAGCGGSLADLVPEPAQMTTFNAKQWARRTVQLASDAQQARENIASLRRAATPYTWQGVAQRLVEVCIGAIGSTASSEMPGPRMALQDDAVPNLGGAMFANLTDAQVERDKALASVAQLKEALAALEFQISGLREDRETLTEVFRSRRWRFMSRLLAIFGR